MRLPVLMFDFGNVIGFFDYMLIFGRLGARLGISADAFKQLVEARGMARLLAEFERGALAPEEFARRIQAEVGLDIPFSEFVADWEDIFELNTTVERDVTREDVLAAYRAAAEGPLAGVLEYSEDPLVSSDITGNPASSVFDAALTRVDGRHVKVVAWYDNEWGFSHRVIDTLELLAAG